MIKLKINKIDYQIDTLEDSPNFNYEFTTIINEVSIEFTGNHMESIIIKNIKLGE
mgnify:CR=1 FL=1